MSELVPTISTQQVKAMDQQLAGGAVQQCALNGQKCGCLARKAKALVDKNARDFTHEEARDYLVYLHQEGEVKIIDPAVTFKNYCCADQCTKGPEIISPAQWSVFRSITMSNKMNGVLFFNEISTGSIPDHIANDKKLDKQKETAERDRLLNENSKKEGEKSKATADKSTLQAAQDTDKATLAETKAKNERVPIQSRINERQKQMRDIDNRMQTINTEIENNAKKIKEIDDRINLLTNILNKTSAERYLRNMDARMIISLSRFAKKANAQLSVTHIGHLGMGVSGVTHSCSNCHWTGHAADISAFIFKDKASYKGIEFPDGLYSNVYLHWGSTVWKVEKKEDPKKAPFPEKLTDYKPQFEKLFNLIKEDFIINDENTIADTGNPNQDAAKNANISIDSKTGINICHPNNDTNHKDHFHIQIGQTEFLPNRYDNSGHTRLCYDLSQVGKGSNNINCNCINVSVQETMIDFFKAKIQPKLDQLNDKYTKHTAQGIKDLDDARADSKKKYEEAQAASDKNEKAKEALAKANDDYTSAHNDQVDAQASGNAQQLTVANARLDKAQNNQSAKSGSANTTANQLANAQLKATDTIHKINLAAKKVRDDWASFKNDNRDALIDISMYCAFMDFIHSQDGAALAAVEIARENSIPFQTIAGSRIIITNRSALKQQEIALVSRVCERVLADKADTEKERLDNENKWVNAVLNNIGNLRLSAFNNLQSSLVSGFKCGSNQWATQFEKDVNQLFTTGRIPRNYRT